MEPSLTYIERLKKSYYEKQDKLDKAYNEKLTFTARDIMMKYPQFVKNYCAAMGEASFDGVGDTTYAPDDIEPNRPITLIVSSTSFASDMRDVDENVAWPLELRNMLKKHAALCADYEDTLGPHYTPIQLTLKADGTITERIDW